MTEPRDRDFISNGATLGLLVRSEFGGGRVPSFALNLGADAVVFAVAAFAIALAVWAQDPGAQAAAAPATRVAVRQLGYAPARRAGGPTIPPAGLRVARRPTRTAHAG